MRRDPAAMSLLSNCETCMRSTTQTQRQELGCGFEPTPPSRLVVRPWQHPADHAPAPKACIGYTRQLPMVIEVARTRLHWGKGALNEPLTDNMRFAIEVLEVASNDVQAWLTKPKKEGGGGA